MMTKREQVLSGALDALTHEEMMGISGMLSHFINNHGSVTPEYLAMLLSGYGKYWRVSTAANHWG